MKPVDLTEFRDSGLLYLANRALHVYGVALAANRGEDGRTVESLSVVETDDPLGLTFPEEMENDARQRLFSWLARKLVRDGEVLWRPTTKEAQMRDQMAEKPVETPEDTTTTVETETTVRQETPGGPGDGGTDGGGAGDGGTDGGSADE